MKNDEHITCILCPIGCDIRINKNLKKIIEGAKCDKGIEYATNEMLNPMRILTTSVIVKNGTIPLVSVKTNKPIPKNKIFEIIKIIKNTKVKAPILIGDIIIKNILETGSDIIATKTVKKNRINIF